MNLLSAVFHCVWNLFWKGTWMNRGLRRAMYAKSLASRLWCWKCLTRSWKPGRRHTFKWLCYTRRRWLVKYFLWWGRTHRANGLAKEHRSHNAFNSLVSDFSLIELPSQPHRATTTLISTQVIFLANLHSLLPQQGISSDAVEIKVGNRKSKHIARACEFPLPSTSLHHNLLVFHPLHWLRVNLLQERDRLLETLLQLRERLLIILPWHWGGLGYADGKTFGCVAHALDYEGWASAWLLQGIFMNAYQSLRDLREPLSLKAFSRTKDSRNMSIWDGFLSTYFGRWGVACPESSATPGLELHYLVLSRGW